LGPRAWSHGVEKTDVTQDQDLVGAWRGTLLVGGHRRPLAVDITDDGGGLRAVWRMNALVADVGVRKEPGKLTITSRALDLVHEGPVEGELAGHVVGHTGADAAGITFRLSRDPAEYERASNPRIDAELRPVRVASYASPPRMEDGWPVGTLAPDAAANVEAMITDILSEPRQICDGFLIVRDGAILAEEYFYGCTREQLHPVASVTKSVTALLCGIAIERGEFPALDTPVMDLYPEYADRRWARERYPITVRHALTMSAGVKWDEGSTSYSVARNSHSFMNRSGDWIGHVFDLPLIHPPGPVFNYNSGLSVLLGDILARHAGDVGRFAETHLFGPLGIDAFEWRQIREGRHQTGGGLSLRLRDMARLGQFMLQGGRWNARQVVPADWIAECVKVHSRVPDGRGYGYQWWLAMDKPRPEKVNSWSANGVGGQHIHVLPNARTIIVHTGSDYEGGGTELGQRLTAILPSILR
jgi:CubicO group peptidase (beta-lactamase class C family)